MTQQLDRKQIAEGLSPEVTLRDPEKVEDFINQDENPQGFVDWINEIVREVKKYFRHESLGLELFSNPEGSMWDFLILSIATDREVEEAAKIIEGFYDRVWATENLEFKKKLTVDLEF